MRISVLVVSGFLFAACSDGSAERPARVEKHDLDMAQNVAGQASSSTPDTEQSRALVVRGVALGMSSESMSQTAISNQWLSTRGVDERTDKEMWNLYVDDPSCLAAKQSGGDYWADSCQKVGYVEFGPDDRTDAIVFSSIAFNAQDSSFDSFAQQIIENYGLSDVQMAYDDGACMRVAGLGQDGEIVSINGCRSGASFHQMTIKPGSQASGGSVFN